MATKQEIAPKSLFRHHSGRFYEVLHVANRDGVTGPQRPGFPVTVVYRDESGNVWCRPIEDFAEKFELALCGPAETPLSGEFPSR